MNSIIWQPTSIYQPGYDFGILLDGVFANKMLDTKLSSHTQRRMNELVAKLLHKNRTEYYLFHENTAFVQQFSYGRDGIWLASENISQDKMPIRYSSHNVDTSLHAYTLMALVDLWIEYADILKEQ